MFPGKIHVKAISPPEAPVNIFSASAQDPRWCLSIRFANLETCLPLFFTSFFKNKRNCYLYVVCYHSKTYTRCYIEPSFAM